MIAANASAGGGTGSFLITLAVILAVVVAYWVPSIVAWRRRVPHRGSVVVVNALAGWTLVGWVVALAMACRSAPSRA